MALIRLAYWLRSSAFASASAAASGRSSLAIAAFTVDGNASAVRWKDSGTNSAVAFELALADFRFFTSSFPSLLSRKTLGKCFPKVFFLPPPPFLSCFPLPLPAFLALLFHGSGDLDLLSLEQFLT